MVPTPSAAGAASANSLREILNIRKLTAGRCVGKVFRQLRELLRRSAVAVRLRGLRRGLQVCGNLLGDLLVASSRVGLLKLL